MRGLREARPERPRKRPARRFWCWEPGTELRRGALVTEFLAGLFGPLTGLISGALGMLLGLLFWALVVVLVVWLVTQTRIR